MITKTNSRRILGVEKKFLITYELVIFFAPDLSMKISQKLSTSFFERRENHNHSTPKVAPACAMTSKSNDWIRERF